jgi:hypothetical protein
MVPVPAPQWGEDLDAHPVECPAVQLRVRGLLDRGRETSARALELDELEHDLSLDMEPFNLAELLEPPPCADLRRLLR